MTFSFQDTKGNQAAGKVMLLGSKGSSLTTPDPQLIFTDLDDFLHRPAPPTPLTLLFSRKGQAMGGIVGA